MLRVLKIAAAVEAISICLLFLNLFTVHWPAVSSALGPTHGTAYLVVIVSALATAGATTRGKLLALVPAVGGYLALRNLSVDAR
ncbi:DUF3817 domain-containing protein [Kribbella turkmenica]|uniref:DUF3817 domain-containing protein n=1 Tax=Kribbella turkmenica TaxID=2530375 RepID=A0A4R4WYY7_9ACTN|nr:DUF3817 domain-containing protein [Kribbella turkmenica]TDD23041.1 DUF3817 domain-containing protein [Kribbella turkmenica]